jgi:GAF domain-containing protein
MPNETLLVRTLVEMADGLVDEFDVVDLLTLLSGRCVEVLDVAAAGVMLATSDGSLQVVASSSDAMRTLELFQLQSNEGPCVECFRTGLAIVNVDLDALNRRWPLFTPRAVAAGFRSLHSLPMRLRGRTIGAMNMFQQAEGSLQPNDVVAAQALADVATIVIVQHQAATDAQALNEQLQRALNSRIIIEQAKGKISESLGISMDEAFHRLRNHARNHNLRLTSLAEEIATGATAASALDPAAPQRPAPPSRSIS